MLKIAGRSQSGRATPFKTNENGNLMIAGTVYEASIERTEPLTFAGKIKGDFSSNPHVAYAKNANTIPSAKSDYTGTETTDVGYAGFSELGGTSSNTAGKLSGQYGQYVFRFNILEHLKREGNIPPNASVSDLHGLLEEITIGLVGRGYTGTNHGATLRWYNAGTQQTEVIGTNDESTMSEIKKTFENPLTDDGWVNIVFSADAPSDGTNPSTVIIDYVYIAATLSSSKTEKIAVKDSDVSSKIDEMITILRNMKDSPTESISLLKGVNIEDGSENPLSLIKDPEGKSVLRVVDAAPFAYNRDTDRLKVESSFASERLRVDTIFDSATVSPGESLSADLSTTNESEVWFAISFDKNNWSLLVGSLFNPQAGLSATLYPKRNNQTDTPTVKSPLTSLFLPFAPEVASMDEAKKQMLIPGNNVYKILFKNQHTEQGIVTLKVVRVWK